MLPFENGTGWFKHIAPNEASNVHSVFLDKTMEIRTRVLRAPADQLRICFVRQIRFWGKYLGLERSELCGEITHKPFGYRDGTPLAGGSTGLRW